MGIKIPVDFSDVPERGSIRAPEGDYILKIKKVEKKSAKSSGNPMLVVNFVFETGPSDVKGKGIIDRHILVKDSLWTLRNMLEAMGYRVPAKAMKLDTDKMLIGKTVGATIIDGDEYKGRIKSEIGDYIPKSSVGNRVSGEDADDFDMDEDDEEDEEGDGLDTFASDDEDEEIEDEETEEEDEDEDSFSFDEDDEDEEEEVELSFGPSDLEDAKAAELKEYLKEAMDAGYEFELPNKPKKADVLEALSDLFEDEEEDEEDDDEMDDFSLDDVG